MPRYVPACLPACAGAASASGPQDRAAPRRGAQHLGGGVLAQPVQASRRDAQCPRLCPFMG